MQTYSKGRTARVVLITVALFFVSVNVALAQGTNLEGRWGVGLRAGTAILTQDIASGIGGDLGPIVSGNIMYALENFLLLGFNIEWETHAVNAGNTSLGDATTISVIPFMEFRDAEMKPISPYVSFGMGANFNSINRSDIVATAFNRFDLPTTVAVKAGIGADYFLTQNMALNAEAGWKYNSGEANVCIPGNCARLDWRASSFSVLLGFRYFFGS
jgi:hypothetical protein